MIVEDTGAGKICTLVLFIIIASEILSIVLWHVGASSLSS